MNTYCNDCGCCTGGCMRKSDVPGDGEDHNRCHECEEKLQARVLELEKALKESERALDAILSFEEDNLLVVNWHLNGDTEPLNNFFYENGLMEALEMVRAALKPAGGEPHV